MLIHPCNNANRQMTDKPTNNDKLYCKTAVNKVSYSGIQYKVILQNNMKVQNNLFSYNFQEFKTNPVLQFYEITQTLHLKYRKWAF